MAISINVTGMDILRKELAEVEVSPAVRAAISEALRHATGVMGDAAMTASALGVGWDHLKRAHERRLLSQPRRIVTVEDLAALGVKRLA